MKKIFIKKIVVIVFISMLFILYLSNRLITTNTLQIFKDTSEIKINQISQILSANMDTIKTLSDTSYENYLSKARAVTYILESNPEIINDPRELESLAVLMQIDQIHVFDEVGVIIAGTIPEYIGVGVDDGEQIGFFKSILEDPTLELVQEITPATADGVLMQYSAVARKDRRGIVQIGMEPKRMIETLSRTEMSYVFSMVVSDSNEDIFLFDKKTGAIQKSTDEEHDSDNFYDMGFSKNTILNGEVGEVLETENENYYAVISETEHGMVSITTEKDAVIATSNQSVVVVAICLGLISALMIVIIKKFLEIYVIHGIEEIISSLKKITSGNLETVITVDSNPEFKELSTHINTMVGYLLRSTSKVSRIIDAVDFNIAIYEYENNIENVTTTNRLAALLGFSLDDEKTLFEDKRLFEEKICSICQNSQDSEDRTVYSVKFQESDRYIKIKTFHDFSTTMGIVVDVTDDVLRRNKIIYERDYDLLSGLYNRRAFMREAEQLFTNPENLKIACVMLLDMDNLKKVNDGYGHRIGDRLIKAGADILRTSQVINHSLIARQGGDEFTILWYGFETPEQIIEKIEDMRANMLKCSITISETKTHPVRFSAGYVFCSHDSWDIDLFLHQADIAMYTSKKNSKSEYIQYEQHMEKMTLL